MSTPPQPPPEPPPPPGSEPPTRPLPPTRRERFIPGRALTVEDFRSLRRWLAVVGTIAVIAAAVAVYAFLQARDSEDDSASRQHVLTLERTLDQRVAALDRRLSKTGEKSDIQKLDRRLRGTAEESDVAKLDRRLRRVEGDRTDAVDGAASAGRAVARLDERIDKLEESARP